jgi:hypothetical protein
MIWKLKLWSHYLMSNTWRQNGLINTFFLVILFLFVCYCTDYSNTLRHLQSIVSRRIDQTSTFGVAAVAGDTCESNVFVKICSSSKDLHVYHVDRTVL